MFGVAVSADDQRRLRNRAVAHWRISAKSNGTSAPRGEIRAEFRSRDGHPHVVVASLTGEALAAYRVDLRGGRYHLRAIPLDRVLPLTPRARSRALLEGSKDRLLWSAALRERSAAHLARSRAARSNAVALRGQARVSQPGSHHLIAQALARQADAAAQITRAAASLQHAAATHRRSLALRSHSSRLRARSAALRSEASSHAARRPHPSVSLTRGLAA